MEIELSLLFSVFVEHPSPSSLAFSLLPSFFRLLSRARAYARLVTLEGEKKSIEASTAEAEGS